jgi:Fe-S-cluster containining protein
MLPILNDTIECSCADCVSACHRKPGWFAPSEIKPAADLMGLTEQEFFKQYLSVDYYYDKPNSHLFVLSPATDKSVPGEEFPLEPTGRCVFLTENGQCGIHNAKPYECKIFDHRKLDTEGFDTHKAVAEEWTAHKDYIAGLLGREPEVKEPTFVEALKFLFGMIQPGK